MANEGIYTGETIDGYTIGPIFREGGMGQLYTAANNPHLLWKIPASIDAMAIARAEREIEAMTALKDAPRGHLKMGPTGHYKKILPYFWMEKIEGPSLRESLANSGSPFPRWRTLVIGWLLTDAMAYAHAKGVCHRDLKPDNILLLAGDQPVIIDWGLARYAGASSLTHGMIGTLLYMAPEQVKGEGDARSDVYALGIILYEMLTGHWPYAETPPTARYDIGEMILRHTPVNPRDYEPTIAEPTANICLRCLEKDSLNRYPTATALRDELWPEVVQVLWSEATSRHGNRAARPGSLEILEEMIRLKGYVMACDKVKEFFREVVYQKPVDIFPVSDLQKLALQEVQAAGVSKASDFPILPIVHLSERYSYVILARANPSLAARLQEEDFPWSEESVLTFLQRLQAAWAIVPSSLSLSLELKEIGWENGPQFLVKPTSSPLTSQAVVDLLQAVWNQRMVPVPPLFVDLVAEGENSLETWWKPENILLAALQAEVEEKRKAELAAPQDWPGDLWRACWNTAGWIDFTASAWANLSCAEHVRYAKAYQEWYAVQKKLDIAKQMPVGKTPMILRLIPPGRFRMGSPASEPARSNDEVQHGVLISKPFYLGQYEVTQAQWEAVMGNNPSFFKGDANLPVETVSWKECQGFCQKTGLALPSEAQWEYACRAGTLTPFNLGKNITPKFVNYHGDYLYANGTKGVHRGKTVPVGSLANENAWGCYDFHGNLYEWCSDWYGNYPTEEVENPKGSANGSARVLRGGCWGHDARSCRSASRFCAPDGQGLLVGVRLQVIIAGF